MQPTGEQIKAEMEKAGLCTRDVAILTGHIRRILSDERKIGYATWKLICIHSGEMNHEHIKLRGSK